MPINPKPPFQLPDLFNSNGLGNDVIELGSGQVFFAQGDEADSVYSLKEGRAKVVVISGQGREAVIGIVGAGGFFGEQCLSGQAQRMASVLAIEDSVALRMSK